LAEQTYDDLRKHDEQVWDAARLSTELAGVDELVARYAHVNEVVLGRKGPGRRVDRDRMMLVEAESVRALIKRLDEVQGAGDKQVLRALADVRTTLNAFGTERLPKIISGTLESLPSLARELGKEPPVVSIDENDIAVRAQASGMLRNLFTHLLRNSIDHGIELATERQAKGKPVQGHIQLSLAMESSGLRIRLQDDGRGLAIGKIRQRSLEQGDSSAMTATASELAQLIFKSGFSTAEKVTEVSGRGVGMDAVRGFLEKEGGSIAVRLLDDNEAAEYRPFEIIIDLPERFAAKAPLSARLGGATSAGERGVPNV
jgi:hypothetical protein